MEYLSHSVRDLHHSLWCRDAAVKLCANDLLFFQSEEDGTKLMVWCGRAFQPDMVEDAECWEEATWGDIPLLVELYNKYGDLGIFVWCAKKRSAPREILSNAVNAVYPMVSAHIHHAKFIKSWNVMLHQ